MAAASLVMPGSIRPALAMSVDLTLDSPTTPTGFFSQKTPTAANPLSLPDVGWSGDSPTTSLAPGINVLCADDNPIARGILAKLLHGKGVAFEMAVDGFDAVDKYKRQPFSLLLLDVQMPKMDGIQAANEIRAYEKANGLKRVRIIALSGLSNEIDKAAALDGRNGEPGPVDCFITKGGKSLRLILDELAAAQEARGGPPI
ncbi:hypothetical protein RQP46_010223 [Phenoliferia psychrophenolica]